MYGCHCRLPEIMYTAGYWWKSTIASVVICEDLQKANKEIWALIQYVPELASYFLLDISVYIISIIATVLASKGDNAGQAAKQYDYSMWCTVKQRYDNSKHNSNQTVHMLYYAGDSWRWIVWERQANAPECIAILAQKGVTNRSDREHQRLERIKSYK